MAENYEQSPARTLTFRVKTAPEAEYFFEFTVQKDAPGLWRVTMMENHLREEYRGKGIPEALILRLAEPAGLTVCSSSNRGAAGEYRTPPASKIWERLVAQRRARFDAEQDRYFTVRSA